MSKSVLRPREPKEATLARRPDNRRCEHCKVLVHKDLLLRHLATKHGIVMEALSSPAPAVTPARKIAAKIQTAVKKNTTNAMNNAKKPKRKKKRTGFNAQYTDGQPRFEGGIMWSQAGSPGLGKRR